MRARWIEKGNAPLVFVAESETLLKRTAEDEVEVVSHQTETQHSDHIFMTQYRHLVHSEYELLTVPENHSPLQPLAAYMVKLSLTHISYIFQGDESPSVTGS